MKPYVELNDGYKMPRVGLGMWQVIPFDFVLISRSLRKS